MATVKIARTPAGAYVTGITGWGVGRLKLKGYGIVYVARLRLSPSYARVIYPKNVREGEYEVEELVTLRGDEIWEVLERLGFSKLKGSVRVSSTAKSGQKHIVKVSLTPTPPQGRYPVRWRGGFGVLSVTTYATIYVRHGTEPRAGDVLYPLGGDLLPFVLCRYIEREEELWAVIRMWGLSLRVSRMRHNSTSNENSSLDASPEDILGLVKLFCPSTYSYLTSLLEENGVGVDDVFKRFLEIGMKSCSRKRLPLPYRCAVALTFATIHTLYRKGITPCIRELILSARGALRRDCNTYCAAFSRYVLDLLRENPPESPPPEKVLKWLAPDIREDDRVRVLKLYKRVRGCLKKVGPIAHYRNSDAIALAIALILLGLSSESVMAKKLMVSETFLAKYASAVKSVICHD